MVSQLITYGWFWWIVFILIAFTLARIGGVFGIVFGHLAVAAIVVVLDAIWIQSEMRKPGWDGTPDMDFVFYVGLLIRIVLINFLLLPVSIVGYTARKFSVAKP